MVILDYKRPLFIPYGYPRIGNTMVVQRLLRFLSSNDYVVRSELTNSSISRTQMEQQIIEERYEIRRLNSLLNGM